MRKSIYLGTSFESVKIKSVFFYLSKTLNCQIHWDIQIIILENDTFESVRFKRGMVDRLRQWHVCNHIIVFKYHTLSINAVD